jgi:hypothetical protein
MFLYGGAAHLTARYGLEYGEAIVLWQAEKISVPTEAYHPIEQYPYMVFHYPPLFHVVSRVAGWATGDLLIGGRLVTYCSALAIMSALGVMVFRSQSSADPTARSVGALAAVLLPAALPNMRDWVPHMRVDMLGVMLSLLSMWAFIESRNRPGLRYLALVGFVAALYTKQILLSAPLAALVMTAKESRKEALKCAGLAVLMGSVPLIAMQFATNGQFVTHLFVHNQNAYTVRRAVEMTSTNAWETLPVLVLALAAVVSWLAGPRRPTGGPDGTDFTMRCWTTYLVFAFVMSWTSGKWGSASNYFLEFNLICCILAGLAVTRALDQSRRANTLATAAVGLLLVVAGTRWLPSTANYAFNFSAGSRALAAARDAEKRQALDIVRREPGPVFSWDLMVLMLAHKDIPLEPAIMFELTRAGKWDISPFLEQIRKGYYTLIVANSDTDWLSFDPVSEAMAAAYAPAEQFGSYRFYRPMRR